MEERLKQDDIQWLLRTLRKIDFFEPVSLENIDKVVSGFVKKRYRRGEVIIKEGAEGTALFVIKSGRCLVYRKKNFFIKEKLAVLTSGDFFGEMSLLFDDLTSASVKALEPTEVFVYFKNDFLTWLKNNPKLEEEIRVIAERRRYKNIMFSKK